MRPHNHSRMVAAEQNIYGHSNNGHSARLSRKATISPNEFEWHFVYDVDRNSVRSQIKSLFIQINSNILQYGKIVGFFVAVSAHLASEAFAGRDGCHMLERKFLNGANHSALHTFISDSFRRSCPAETIAPE